MSNIAPFDTEFAYSVYRDKYGRTRGRDENWSETARRVAEHVIEALPSSRRADTTVTGIQRLKEQAFGRINRREFIPGGRYLYATGLRFHQTQNCLLLRAEDTREGWGELAYKVEMASLTGAGIGVYYGDLREAGAGIRRTGGIASGPIPKAIAINEQGRAAVQGGNRRSALWGGLLWSHPDCDRWIRTKDWPGWLREQKAKDPNTPASLDMTNISVCLDDEFFEAYENPTHPWYDRAHYIYEKTVDKMVTTGEPGFSVDLGNRSNEKLRNAPVAGATHVLTRAGYKQVQELIGVPTGVWTGKQWASDVVFEQTQAEASIVRVMMTGGREIRCEPSHEFLVERWIGAGKQRSLVRIDRIAAKDLRAEDQLHVSLPAAPPPRPLDPVAYTLGFVYGDGSFTSSGGAELTLCTEASKACLPKLVGYRGVNHCDSRGYTRLYFARNEYWQERSKSVFPSDVLHGSRSKLLAFIAGLFDSDGNWEPTQKRLRLASKHREFLRGVARALESVGILAHISKAGTSTHGKTQGWQLVIAAEHSKRFSELIATQRIQPNLDNYEAYRSAHVKVLTVEEDSNEAVYCADVGVEEHSFMAEGVIISNCTEIVSEDDSDVCNLGGVVLARFEDPQEFGKAVRDGVIFLTAGTFYSDVPYDKVAEVREKNRRLGLDILGVHEFLLKLGLKYGSDDAFYALEPYMKEYERALEYANDFQDKLGCSRSIAATSGAPTGTRGIIAETTTGWEPVTAAAYKRVVIDSDTTNGDKRTTHYVIDPTVKRLVAAGYIDRHATVEDSYSLAYDVESRFAMQAYAQAYTDQGISMTINLPKPLRSKQEQADFGRLLYRYLPKFRGITVYPNGARDGQPITPISVEEALAHNNVRIEEDEEKCTSGVCGL